MNKAENNITEQLTGKPSLKEVSVEELRQLTKHYPYFSAAHYLLSKKLKQENDNNFLPAVQKTVLYFSNPHWLHYQLMQEDKADEVSDIKQEKAIQDAVLSMENDLPAANENVSNFQSENVEMPVTETMQQLTEQEEAILKEPITETENDLHNKEEHSDGIGVINPQPEQTYTATENTTSTTEVNSEPELPSLDEEEKIEHVVTKEEEIESNTRLSQILDEQAKEFNKPVEENATMPIALEPYHTVDYFASQGIKLEQQELQPNDNLGNKVRKFTDWLKQMKRISPQPADLGTTVEMETAVQTSAASSNEPKEIITEAMAEVLLKQGKMDKAIELYMKLSFLNPAKTAYFAAKIQQLKQV